MLARLLAPFSRRNTIGYTALPPSTATSTSPRHRIRPPLPWIQSSSPRGGWSLKPVLVRVVAVFVGALVGLAILLLWYFKFTDIYHGLPTYKSIRAAESALPQHDPSLRWPEGRNGRFVKFATPYRHVGFNNQLQDILLLAHIAHISNRAYVFQPYIWSEHWWLGPVRWYRGQWRSALIPLTAFLAGPTAGGAFQPGTGTTPTGKSAEWASPRAVSYDFFDDVCPWWRRTYVSVKATRTKYGVEERDGSPETKEIIEAFGKELLEMKDSCVVVLDEHVITLEALGRRVLSAFEMIRSSPVIRQFSWSPTIQDIVSRNMPLVNGTSHWSQADWAAQLQRPQSTLSGVVGIHVRRGYFIEHCPNLAEWRAVYYGWNMFSEYRDQFGNPWDFGPDEQRIATYFEHCLPTIDQMLAKLRVVKADWESGSGKGKPPLNRVYILTNADSQFQKELQLRLHAEGWGHVSLSNELVLTPEEREIDLAADMMIAERAEVFVGNGFSSLTSNVNLLRMARGAPSDSIRFW